MKSSPGKRKESNRNAADFKVYEIKTELEGLRFKKHLEKSID